MTIEGYTKCSHGRIGPHCTQDNEGSCPFEYDRDNPDAVCRCSESEWKEVDVKFVDATPIPWCKTHDAQMVPAYGIDPALDECWVAVWTAIPGVCQEEPQAVYRIGGE